MGNKIMEAHSDSSHSITGSSSIDSNTSSNSSSNTKKRSMRSLLKGRKEAGTHTIRLRMAESFTLSMVGIKIFSMNSTKNNKKNLGGK